MSGGRGGHAWERQADQGRAGWHAPCIERKARHGPLVPRSSMTAMILYPGPAPSGSASLAGVEGHYCPCCLKWVSAGRAERRAHREACGSGELNVVLLQCPACSLVLAAEVDLLARGQEAAPAG